MDPEDSCPLRPEDRDGFEDIDGCPDLDNDQDKVLDTSDGCPMKPEDLDGFEDTDGCPDPDNDQDGILDRNDQCPVEPENLNGIDDEDGCPESGHDGDGLLGSLDQCPNEAEDVDTFQDDDGCPDADNDGDGIADSADSCPLDAETVNQFNDADGCPDEVPAEVEKFEGILKGVKFQTGRAKIRRVSDRVLNRAVAVLKKYPDVKIEVQGHTDSVGSDLKNLTLSEARANAVMDYLVRKGVAAQQLTARGYGEAVPIADNATRAGRAQNRRVELRRR